MCKQDKLPRKGEIGGGNHMKRILVPLAVALLMVLAVPAAFAEWELGMGWSPSQNSTSTDPTAVNSIINFHVGYSWTVLYFSWDSYALPDYWVYNLTTSTDPVTGYTTYGDYVPGFMNLFDVGLKLVLRPIIGYLEVGTNALYEYGGKFYSGGLGVNARAGVGLKFGWWGVNVSGTQTFAKWNDMVAGFKDAFHGNFSTLADGALLSFNLALYF
jgi:hypothetical protein